MKCVALASEHVYLAKLRRLLPARHRHRNGGRRLTKLQLIHRVIQYICDLQAELLSLPPSQLLLQMAAKNVRREEVSRGY